MVACGDNYTVAGTNNNALYMWGKGPQHTPSPSDEGTKTSTEMTNLDIPQDRLRERRLSGGSIGSSGSLIAPEKSSNSPRDASPAPSLSKF